MAVRKSISCYSDKNNKAAPMIEIITTPWKRRPENGASTRHRFAIGDIHGHADLLQSLLGHIEALPARGARDIIFTGDIFDRGPENFRALALALGRGCAL